MKHSAAYKPNQEIRKELWKKELGKKRNNSEIALNGPTRRDESSAGYNFTHLKNKMKPVIFGLFVLPKHGEKHSSKHSKGNERLEKLPC